MRREPCIIDFTAGLAECRGVGVSEIQPKAYLITGINSPVITVSPAGNRGVCSGSEFAGVFVWGSRVFSLWIPVAGDIVCRSHGYDKVSVSPIPHPGITNSYDPGADIVERLGGFYGLPIIVINNGGEYTPALPEYNLLVLGHGDAVKAVKEAIERFISYYKLEGELSGILPRLILSRTISIDVLPRLREKLVMGVYDLGFEEGYTTLIVGELTIRVKENSVCVADNGGEA